MIPESPPRRATLRTLPEIVAATRGCVVVADSVPVPPTTPTEPVLLQMSVIEDGWIVIGSGSGGSVLPFSVLTETVVRWPTESVTMTVALVTQMVGLLAATVNLPGFDEDCVGVTKTLALVLTAEKGGMPPNT